MILNGNQQKLIYILVESQKLVSELSLRTNNDEKKKIELILIY